MSNTTTVNRLTPGQVAAIQQYAVGPAACASLLYGIYLIISMRAIHLLMRRGLRTSRPRCILLATIVMMFLATTTVFRRDIQAALEQVSFIGDTSYSAPFQYHDFASVAAGCMLVLMSDMIVVWRTWVICDRWLVKITLSCCMAGSCGILFPVISRMHMVTSNQLESFLLVWPGSKLLLQDFRVHWECFYLWSYLYLSPMLSQLWELLTLPGYTAVLRKKVSMDVQMAALFAAYWDFFVESGLLYVVVWLLDVTSFLISPTSVEFYYVCMTVNYMLAIYPATVIILVTQRTPLPESKAPAPPFHLPAVQVRSIPSIIINIGFEAQQKELCTSV
ncbi:hypothetical protein C8J56DRAFT_893197 [Mycena floridula]|nr:hypothetical protein C8J56DRAFT_893197 [Mycena floridula]